MQPTHNPASSTRVVLAAVAGNSLITVAKFIGWLFTGSPSMLAESVHSFADSANQVLLFIGIKHSSSGPSRAYPKGKGSARYLWNLISAIGIFFVGFGATMVHGVNSLISPHPYTPSESLWIPLSILAGSFIIEGYVLILAAKEVWALKGSETLAHYIKHGDDPTTIAVLLEDGVAVLGITLALLGIWISSLVQSNIPDAIAAIFIAGLLGIMALVLAYANGRLLIGAAAEEEEEIDIRKYIEALAIVEKVTAMSTEVLGPFSLRLSVEVEFHGGILIDRNQIYMDAEKIRSGSPPLPILVDTAERMVRVMGKEINAMESDLRKRFPQLQVIEVEVN